MAVQAWSYLPLTAVTGLVPPLTSPHDDLADRAAETLGRACESVVGRDVVLNRIVEERSAAQQCANHAPCPLVTVRS